MKFHNHGFTLIELMVVVALASILAALAAPNFRGMLDRRAVLAAAQTLVDDIRYARAEAIRRTATVSICSSSNQTGCTAAASWSSGWIVFADADGDGSVDTGDTVLRVQTGPSGVASMGSNAPVNDKLSFTYQPTGWARAANQTFFIRPTGSTAGAAYVSNRDACIVISVTGRISLRSWGSSTCTET